ncbi:MAG: DUF45 domain-containing protein [Oxalobacteraceae bacterium]|nr:DUF45 domain-containing protein [Oxalobacteraceae bacterium]
MHNKDVLPATPKDYLPRQRKVLWGNSFNPWAGRTYRLRLVDECDVAVKLQGGRFVMPKALASVGREHLIRWYCERARPGRWTKMQDCASRIDVTPARIHVQYLGYRWGYAARGALLYFHWKTILLPARIAEYVGVHEMAHLHAQHHTREFWRRAERAMPDFERRKV